jgi:N6-L-threonylcarbamoyladenine synthase
LSDTGVERTFASETVLKADECIALWAERSDVSDLIICGNALIKYRDRFEDAGLTNIVDEELWYPSGLGLLRATWTGTGDPALVLPIYTRLSDAEENERKRLGLKVPESASVTGVAEGLAGRHLQLRPMSVNDLNQVAELEGETYAHAAHEAWSLAMFEDELALPGRTWWVAHDGAEIVGFAGAVLAGDTLEILDVVVSPARRREHIASRLLRSVAYDGHVLGAVSLSLEVEEDNEAAQALYDYMDKELCGRLLVEEYDENLSWSEQPESVRRTASEIMGRFAQKVREVRSEYLGEGWVDDDSLAFAYLLAHAQNCGFGIWREEETL